MSIYIHNGWMWFCISFAVMLSVALIMKIQSRNFYTNDVVIRKFTMMDLELPASAREIVNLIKGIYLLPSKGIQKTLRSLKGQLYADFIFMPAAYGSIFLLCMQVSLKTSSTAHWILAIIAWLQVMAWLCDIIENIYLLNKIRPDVVVSGNAIHNAYTILEFIKWSIILTGVICSVFALLYFWLAGDYASNSLRYLVIILIEITLFISAVEISGKKFKEEYNV